MNEQEKAVKCIDEIKDTLEKYEFTIAGDWNGDAYIRSRNSGETYDLD